jgi:hypothetical protein
MENNHKPKNMDLSEIAVNSFQNGESDIDYSSLSSSQKEFIQSLPKDLHNEVFSQLKSIVIRFQKQHH